MENIEIKARCEDHEEIRKILDSEKVVLKDKIYQKDEADQNRKSYSDTFKNNRSQYYAELARRAYNTYRCVTRNEYVDPDDMVSFDSDGIESWDLLRTELTSIPRKDNPNGLYQIMSKVDMKKLGVNSPNIADCIMMSLSKLPDSKKPKRKLNYQRVSIA